MDDGCTINLVEEDDGGLHLPCLIEEEPQLSFCLADPFAQAIGSLAHEERHLLARLPSKTASTITHANSEIKRKR
jgi:hypothetical protein